jgi:hypothetical protein
MKTNADWGYTDLLGSIILIIAGYLLYKFTFVVEFLLRLAGYWWSAVGLIILLVVVALSLLVFRDAYRKKVKHIQHLEALLTINKIQYDKFIDTMMKPQEE